LQSSNAAYLALFTLPSWIRTVRERKYNQAVSPTMIKSLANLFRGFSLVFGITAPPPGENERPFVLLWLGIIGVVIVFSVLLFYLLSHLHVA
jgi:hypothetical protein